MLNNSAGVCYFKFCILEFLLRIRRSDSRSLARLRPHTHPTPHARFLAPSHARSHTAMGYMGRRVNGAARVVNGSKSALRRPAEPEDDVEHEIAV